MHFLTIFDLKRRKKCHSMGCLWGAGQKKMKISMNNYQLFRTFAALLNAGRSRPRP